MRKKITGTAFALGVALCLMPNNADAIPALQLDIEGGSFYDTDTDTIVTRSKVFSLYALLMPTDVNPLSDTYYISAALTPQTDSAASLGSFIFAGDVVDVTAGMVYGVPPLEANLEHDYRDLQPHGIYPTYYKEFGFQFDSADSITAYSSQTRAKHGWDLNTDYNADGAMYFAKFDVDIDDLAPGYQIHFDLYNSAVKLGDVDVTKYAPFWHDAETVPEPGTLLLMGSGLMGFYFSRKLRRK
jgi:hypothetical protein